MNAKSVFAVAFPVLVAAVISYANVTTARRGAFTEQDLIPTPDSWVPFAADVRTTDPVRPTVLGRFYRSGDGSTRTDTTVEGDTKVLINNVALNTCYRYFRATGWMSNPMALPPGGFTPFKYRRDSAELSLHADKVEGFEVYRQVNATSREVSLLAPELNMFAIRVTRSDGGTLEYLNIQSGEPAPGTFEPPPGAPIKHNSEPAGIVWVPRKKN